MSKNVINLETVIGLLEKAVEKKGAHYVDPNSADLNCVYAAYGAPSCIVGHVLVDLGIPAEKLEGQEGTVSLVFGLYGSGEYENETVIESLEYTEQAVRILSAAQSAQDNGESWGEALEAARKARDQKVAYLAEKGEEEK